MREAIAVEVRFEPDGRLRPLAFELGGRRHAVAAVGRQWAESERRHVLVMTPDERIYELVFDPGEGVWEVGRRPSADTGQPLV